MSEQIDREADAVRCGYVSDGEPAQSDGMSPLEIVARAWVDQFYPRDMQAHPDDDHYYLKRLMKELGHYRDAGCPDDGPAAEKFEEEIMVFAISEMDAIASDLCRDVRWNIALRTQECPEKFAAASVPMGRVVRFVCRL